MAGCSWRPGGVFPLQGLEPADGRVREPCARRRPKHTHCLSRGPPAPLVPAGSAGRTWGRTGPGPAPRPPRSRLRKGLVRSPAQRAASPWLPAHAAGRGKAAPFGITRRRTGQSRRPHNPQHAGRGTALTSCSSHSGSHHPNAANENRTCWRQRQEEGKSGPEAAIVPQRPLSSGGRTVPAAPKEVASAGFSLHSRGSPRALVR